MSPDLFSANDKEMKVELNLESLKLWQSEVGSKRVAEKTSIDPHTIKLDPSYLEWLALYPNGISLEAA